SADLTQLELRCDHGRGHGPGANEDQAIGDQVFGAHGQDPSDQGEDDDDQGEAQDCDLWCHDHPGNDYVHGGQHRDDCDIVGVRACFSTQALIGFFAGSTSSGSHDPHQRGPLPCALLDARIVATLTNGETVMALFEGRDPHDHDGDGDHDGHGHKLGQSADALRPKVAPNPINPTTVLSFSMKQDGQVQVAVYDMQGRLVK